MKTRPLKILTMIFLMVISCDEPETVVTNYIHPDGSVTRKIEMRNIENKFKVSTLQIPFDSTWKVRDSIEISDKGDTTWVKRAEKLFLNAKEINASYKSDSGANKIISRHVNLKKSFRWFFTEYRFSESIDRKLTFGYPVADFLNQEELAFFYSPGSLTDEKKSGPDSLKFRTLSDSVNKKISEWETRNLVSGWINEFTSMTEGPGSTEMDNNLKTKENEIARLTQSYEKFDSLWENGLVLKDFIGQENALRFKDEADSALNLIVDQYAFNFSEYSVRIVMPGKLTVTNGFADSSNVLLWPVRSNYFRTQPYEMWSESKVPNHWAWFVTVLFLFFVLTGIIIRVMKKS